MTTILPIASGKGGVGKTVFAANLGVALARYGKTVILVDLDLGGSNLHTCLGIRNRNPGIGSFINKKAESLESLVIPTETERLFFIPGDSLLPGTANLPFFMKQRILKELGSLVADYIILDLAAGSAYNTVDFFLASEVGLIVTTPETTSILNAYSFLKTTIYRIMYRSFPAKSEERSAIEQFVMEKVEGSDSSFANLIGILESLREGSGLIVSEQLKRFFPRVVLNKGRTGKDLSVGMRLRDIARKNIGIEMEYIGFLKDDQAVVQSVAARKPACLLAPQAEFSVGVDRVAQKVVAAPAIPGPVLYEANEDIEALRELIEQEREQNGEPLEFQE